MRLFLLFFCALILNMTNAHAACTSPNGIAGTLEYFGAPDNKFKFCNGSLWVNWGEGGTGDNLGNHTATQNLSMGSYNITGTGSITANSFTGSGTSLTNLNATNLSSGIAASARLGTGTANNTVFLRGDNTWTNTLNGTLTVATPTASGHAATKAYVDSAMAASGSTSYAGVTPTSYTGNLGGPKGAHQKCHAAFPGSRMITTSESFRIMPNISSSTPGWIFCDETVTVEGYVSCQHSIAQQASNYGVNCSLFNAASVGPIGYIFTGSTGTVTAQGCSGTAPIHCVYN